MYWTRSIVVLLFAFAGSAAAAEYSLPFKGRWFVMQGGDTPNVNHHMAVRAQYFGVDFAKVGGPTERSLTKGPGVALDNFYGWHEPVMAPVDGEVVTAADSFPDNPVGTHDTDHPFGNHVVIKTADGAYVFLAHFSTGTIKVKPGQRVSVGDVLGLCGNSGNSDFPHIHMHVQDSLGAGAAGMNVQFAHMDVELTGKQFRDVTWPVIRGLFVSD